MQAARNRGAGPVIIARAPLVGRSTAFAARLRQCYRSTVAIEMAKPRARFPDGFRYIRASKGHLRGGARAA